MQRRPSTEGGKGIHRGTEETDGILEQAGGPNDGDTPLRRSFLSTQLAILYLEAYRKHLGRRCIARTRQRQDSTRPQQFRIAHVRLGGALAHCKPLRLFTQRARM